jgi:glycosyltransferase involved in cell wall biosynthesis
VHFYWYFPFARPEELDWARGTARRGERVTVHVIDRDAAPHASDDGVLRVVRDLPDVDRGTKGAARWALSRLSTYSARERLRRDRWRAEPFDLVHVHYVNRFTDVWSPLPRPFVMSVHDVLPHVPRVGRRTEHQLLRRLYHRPDALVVHHERLADRLRSDFGVPSDRIHVVPHEVFPVDGPPVDPPASTPTVLFFGALRRNKGVELLGPMMEHLDLDLQLRIAGRGEPEVEQQVRTAADRDPRIRPEIGFASLARKQELFREAQVIVLPYTTFASQSGVLHDAYGHGRPVVVTDVGALGATVREDGTGLVVPPGDPRALARAVRALLDPGTWRHHADAARRVAAERSPAAIGARLREVYDLVLP